MNAWVRIHHSAALLAIAVASFGFATASTQLPRPWILFGGIAAAVGILTHRVLRYDVPSCIESISIIGETVLIAYFLRVTGYLHLAASGRDTQMWAGGIGQIVETGYVSPGGMYGASPVYFLEVAVSGIILGPMSRSASVLGEHNITIAVASLLPVLVAAITVRFAGRRAGLIAGLLATVFPLYLRTATLYESEHLTLPWFALLVLLFQVSATRRDRLVSTTFALVLVASAWLHFFYATVFVALFSGAIIVRDLMESFPFLPNSRPQIPVLGVITGGVLLSFHILWSGWAGHAVGVLSSLFTISVPTSLSGLLVPSTGAAASSVGGGGESGASLLATVVKYLPLGLPVALAGVGGLYALARPKRYSMEVIAIAVVGVGATAVLLVAQLGYNLHFRMFYFVGTLALVFAGAVLVRGSDLNLDHWEIAPLVLSLLVLSVAITGPISPMGNNVDPGIDRSESVGELWATRSTTWMQKEHLGTFASGPEPLEERTDAFISGPKPGRFSKNPSPLVVDDASCESESVVWDSGSVYGCINETAR
ncbi:hypothetical protein C5B91_09025 [Haloferax sp. Atlit-10N]|uniref:hypothetical protein n=1 Tax=unclassified Haloferax TaxID=2625095 RepID=UPI000E3A48EE|nr:MULTISPECIES: hypothetical protein [unclassified Haloferax]RDZ59352.1 hypothetical protein C5B91_09025 [Haloferax sp. Atlit-10N]